MSPTSTSVLQPTGSNFQGTSGSGLQSTSGSGILNDPASTISTPQADNGAYWVGSNGHVYLKGSGGDKAAVNDLGLSGNVKQSDLGQAVQIDDPNPPAQALAPVKSSTYQNKSNDITLANAGLNEVDNTRDTAINKVNEALGTITGQYEGDLNKAKDSYSSNTDSNQNDLQTNKQVSLENAVEGRKGLYGTLASIGALNGDGVNLANDAVAKGANSDLTTAADNYATNQRGLDTSYNAYVDGTKKAEDKAKTNGANDITQANNDAAKNRQAYLKNLADAYTAQGDEATAKHYTDQAAALQPTISQTNVPTIDLGYTGSAYTAPTLSQYVGKANNTTVNTTPSAPGSLLNIPGLVATNKKQVE